MIVYLIGFMAAGKTYTGALAARQLNIPFLDLDEELERRSGSSIRQFIQTEGLDRFRQLESEILLETPKFVSNITAPQPDLAQNPHINIATGGGCVLSAENRTFFQTSGCPVIWLNPPWKILQKRLLSNPRPLLQGLSKPEIYRLYLDRLPFYQQCSTHIISQTDSLPEVISFYK